jgi:oligoribonuclease NrnB/cAMP/cGMP phosphodiesterase (DHH superfamily)
MRRVCFFHAGCPDGLGAAWAVRQFWGESAEYLPRGHEDSILADDFDGAMIAYVDISPSNDELIALAEIAAQVVVLDHHVSARDRVEADPAVANAIAGRGHQLLFDLGHSGAVLAWQYFAGDEPVPDLLRYVEDQDLWSWKLPRSLEVNTAIGSYPLRFEIWDELARRSIDDLAAEGEPLVRANRTEIDRAVSGAGAILIGTRRVEAVNATTNRSRIGHELAKRAAFGDRCGCVYRVVGRRVYASLYSIDDFDVATIATELGGGGHRNAAGFSVSLDTWLEMALEV